MKVPGRINWPRFITPRMDPKPMRRDQRTPREPPRPPPLPHEVVAEFARRFPNHPAPLMQPITAAEVSAKLAACLKGDGTVKAGYRQRARVLRAMIAGEVEGSGP